MPDEKKALEDVALDVVRTRDGHDVYGHRVVGDSMIDAGILEGDYVFVKKDATHRGDVVVAQIGERVVLAYYYPENGYVRFQPANMQMAPILVPDAEFDPSMLHGNVIGLFRRY